MTSRERLSLLQNMPFFGAINDDCVELILSHSSSVKVTGQDYFYHQGEQGDCLYVLEHGQVDILREAEQGSVRLAVIESGGFFGELALIACTARTAAARALNDCSAIRVPQEALQYLYVHDREQFLLLQMNMSREVCRRLIEIDDLWFKHQLSQQT